MKKFTFNLVMLILMAAFPLLFIAGIQQPGNKNRHKPLPARHESARELVNQQYNGSLTYTGMDWNPVLAVPSIAKY
ncbi:MAG TPA: hypothetical protein PLC48_01375 [Ferruginibacter sp.]|nr:hypothetical protein [Ferruginibacter sp.]